MKIVFAFLFLVANMQMFAQTNNSLKGKVVDTINNKPLYRSSVSLLNQKDSTLVKFVWTTKGGDFELKYLSSGNYILFISYPNYADYVDVFTLGTEHYDKDFGSIKLISKVNLLSEVVIKGQRAILKIKGDTIEFDSKIFNFQPHDKVEDMLKQIPGIQVQRNGKITAYGQKVDKVLLDGEEFFGDDPTLITRNIRADMVDKIQLFDKKSDMATAIGINDGNDKNFLNIKLKEDKKKGLFGKLSSGFGNKDIYQSQAMLNVFNHQKKIAIFSNVANTGKVGLSQSDTKKYGFSNKLINVFDGSILSSYLSSSDSDFASERYNGQGLPSAASVGAHFDQKFASYKQYINADYVFGSLDVKGKMNTLNKSQVNNSILSNANDRDFNNGTYIHKINGSYKITLDSLSLLEITFGANLKNNENRNTFINTSSYSNVGTLFNSNRMISTIGDLANIGSIAFYVKRFKKARRYLSLSFNQYSYSNLEDTYLNVSTNFVNQNQTLDSTQYINQFKLNKLKGNLVSGELNFSEPIAKNLSTVITYGLGIAKSIAIKKSFNKSIAQTFNELDSAFSNDYHFKESSNRLGSSLVYDKKNIYVTLGLFANQFNFKQLDRTSNQYYNRNYTNWSPKVSFRKSNKQGWLNFSYSGNPVQPSVEQIQPIRVNEDPLNIRVGNANLNPSFLNRFISSYLSSKQSTGRTILLNVDYTFITNSFLYSALVDNAGKTITQTLNLSSKTLNNFNWRGRYSEKLNDLTLSMELRYNNYNNYGYTNNVLIKNHTNLYTVTLNSFIYKMDKYQFEMNISPSFIKTNVLQNVDLSNTGFGLNSDVYLNVTLPKKISLTTTASYSFQGKTKIFDQSNQVLILNTTISKTFLKDKSLKASISGNDLFNKNVGFSRNTLGAYLNEHRYTTVQRYFLFSLAWDFSKFGKSLN